MYSSFQLALKYLHYYVTASNGKGHGIHSPFVFSFITKVLRDKTRYPDYEKVEALRLELLKNDLEIEVEDHGAGSSLIKTKKRKISGIARSSLKSAKYAQLLYSIVKVYRPVTMIELGTSLGTTAAYLALANPEAKLHTLEGAPAVAELAKDHFRRLSLANIELHIGRFSDTLPGLLGKVDAPDLVFVDGHHLKAPTLDYFEQLLRVAKSTTLFIFDDIHWSAEMEEAWQIIKRHTRVTLTIDLFFVSLVFINTDINHKQHFTIRF